MSRVFINIDFNLSPIVWCKKGFDYKKSESMFYVYNENCIISKDIHTYNIKEVCPFAKRIVTNNPTSIIEIYSTNFAKHISMKIPSFVKAFQRIRLDQKLHLHMLTQTQIEWWDICLKCKNSRGN